MWSCKSRNPESFEAGLHGAGFQMSRNEAKRRAPTNLGSQPAVLAWLGTARGVDTRDVSRGGRGEVS
jgi:hypothetical protein